MKEMTANQRWQALKQRQSLDRLPITLCHAGFAAKLAGMNYRESFNTADKLAQRELTIYRELALDALSVSYTSVNFAIRHRSKIKSPRESAPSIADHALKKLDQVDQLSAEATSFDRDIAQRINLEALEKIETAVGSALHPTYCISAPFTLASGIYPAEKMLRATRKDKEGLHRLLRFVTDQVQAIIQRAAQMPEINFFIYDPVASGALISPKQYREFVLPYTKEMVDCIKSYDRCVGMHICGDISHHLEAIAETGVDMISLDQTVDLSLAKEKIGQDLALMGNVDPVRIFLQGSPEEVSQAVVDSYAKAGDNPRGFIIRSGCQLPVDTPVANVEAFMETARSCAQKAAQTWA
ncbi:MULTISPECIES: uroporphyrinogen decarboxylase family protein [Aerococcus]|uniref:Methyltransferase n=1 Tax=Aerococcus sanguinicola TaxID=119206 RepID=A0A5N1GH32_9LACT|nr:MULTISPECIES: uroporphyrinogen decarboxylase family protein [Aerococcus]KAA9300287.1 methyltransferase [Aerococcus sanguinicola]MDK6370150.1 uroporphyrinogen decarboxylase family protein [Aerococcus sp. UMB9870]MDK6680636.1 uroporphyrinogen decarboxylase family protein [Aerococcus sp. UMB8608]MDK6687576.1 uroporphyrinogen decarboxylase family protein [Aerococcus sp. UMB8623]MDK6940586.1 uroporphyrinogen decarboxylase family protein [Aerococcus sp. UMB8487]